MRRARSGRRLSFRETLCDSRKRPPDPTRQAADRRPLPFRLEASPHRRSNGNLPTLCEALARPLRTRRRRRADRPLLTPPPLAATASARRRGGRVGSSPSRTPWTGRDLPPNRNGRPHHLSHPRPPQRAAPLRARPHHRPHHPSLEDKVSTTFSASSLTTPGPTGSRSAMSGPPTASIRSSSSRTRWQNRKVERLNRALQRERAYRQAFASNDERTAALRPGTEHYNHTRRHSALGGKPQSAGCYQPDGRVQLGRVLGRVPAGHDADALANAHHRHRRQHHASPVAEA